MKKTIALLLVVIMALSMTACRRRGKDETPTTDTTQQQASNLSGTMEENVNKIMQANPVEFMGGLMPLDLQDTSEEGLWALKSMTGLDSAEKLKDVAVFEPMTGSQAFSLVLARVADASQAKAIAKEMRENIDPRKWICAAADQVMTAGFGDTVLFIMLDHQLGVTAQSYVDAFATLCGGKLDFID